MAMPLQFGFLELQKVVTLLDPMTDTGPVKPTVACAS